MTLLKLSNPAAALAWDAIPFSFGERESGPGPSHPARVYLKERREKSLSNIGIVNLYANEAERRNCQSSRSCFFFFFLFETLAADARVWCSSRPALSASVRLPPRRAAAADTQTGLFEGRRADVYEPLAGEAGRH